MKIVDNSSGPARLTASTLPNQSPRAMNVTALTSAQVDVVVGTAVNALVALAGGRVPAGSAREFPLAAMPVELGDAAAGFINATERPMAHAEVRELSAMLNKLGTPNDMEAIIAFAESEIRTQAEKNGLRTAETNATSQRLAHQDRVDSLQRALKAAGKRAKRPKWLRKLIKAVITIVGTALSVVTGGASIALMAVGLVLMYAGDKIAAALVKAGLISAKAGMIIGFAAKIAGAICSIGAGLAAGAQLAASAVELAKTVTNVVQGVFEGAAFVTDTHTNVWAHKENLAQLSAQWAGSRSKHFADATQSAIEGVKTSASRHARVSERLLAMSDARHASAMEATKLLA